MKKNAPLDLQVLKKRARYGFRLLKYNDGAGRGAARHIQSRIENEDMAKSVFRLILQQIKESEL